jgi:hypothetical protein
MSDNINFRHDSKYSVYCPNIDSKIITRKNEAMVYANHGRIPRICRACGSTLNPVRFCDCCSEPVKWNCGRCWSMNDITHSHMSGFNFLVDEY